MLCICDRVSFDYKPLPGNVYSAHDKHTNIVTFVSSYTWLKLPQECIELVSNCTIGCEK